MAPRKRNRFLIVILLTVLSASCFAVLGGDSASIQTDQAHLRAQRQVAQGAGYVVHEMQAETGTVIREFVSSEGKVFAVAWQGPLRPDMQQLLGSYYDEYTRSAPARRVHGPLTIQTSNMVLQSGGHQRALTGRAYIPAMVPAGVRIEEIK
jgi:hypothetical protein